MTQAEREALLDLLILSIFTDSHLSLKEDEALQTALEKVGWGATKPRDIFICTSMNRARKAADSETTLNDYLSSRASVFREAASQSAALNLLQQVFASDGTAPSEGAFLARVKASFA
jgi:hypothetical protein